MKGNGGINKQANITCQTQPHDDCHGNKIRVTFSLHYKISKRLY